MTKRITIDPITRIEGHLRVDVEVENNAVSDAWASCTMWFFSRLDLKQLLRRMRWRRGWRRGKN